MHALVNRGGEFAHLGEFLRIGNLPGGDRACVVDGHIVQKLPDLSHDRRGVIRAVGNG